MSAPRNIVAGELVDAVPASARGLVTAADIVGARGVREIRNSATGDVIGEAPAGTNSPVKPPPTTTR